MRTTSFSRAMVYVISLALFAGVGLLPACSVNVKKQANGEEKQVDIKTLVATFTSANRRMSRTLDWRSIPARA